MRPPDDETRFADLIARFIATCGIEPPLYVVTIGSNKSASIALHTTAAIEPLCSHAVQPGFTSPITVTAISAASGAGKSVKIAIENAPPILQ